MQAAFVRVYTCQTGSAIGAYVVFLFYVRRMGQDVQHQNKPRALQTTF